MDYVFLQYTNGQVIGVYGSKERAQAAVESFISSTQVDDEVAILTTSEWMQGRYYGKPSCRRVLKAQDLDTQVRFDIVFEIVEEEVQ